MDFVKPKPPKIKFTKTGMHESAHDHLGLTTVLFFLLVTSASPERCSSARLERNDSVGGRCGCGADRSTDVPGRIQYLQTRRHHTHTWATRLPQVLQVSERKKGLFLKLICWRKYLSFLANNITRLSDVGTGAYYFVFVWHPPQYLATYY